MMSNSHQPISHNSYLHFYVLDFISATQKVRWDMASLLKMRVRIWHKQIHNLKQFSIRLVLSI